MNDFFIRIQNTGITRNIWIVLAELAIDTILVVQGIQFVSDDEFLPQGFFGSLLYVGVAILLNAATWFIYIVAKRRRVKTINSYASGIVDIILVAIPVLYISDFFGMSQLTAFSTTIALFAIGVVIAIIGAILLNK